jgi:hypothetical protein
VVNYYVILSGIRQPRPIAQVIEKVQDAQAQPPRDGQTERPGNPVADVSPEIRSLSEKSPQELQALIEEAFIVLERANERADNAATEEITRRAAEPMPDRRAPARGAGLVRAGKTLLGLVVAVVVGVVPAWRLLTPTSRDAVVNAPLIAIRAPVDGQIVRVDFQPAGRTVAEGTPLFRVAPVEPEEGAPGVPVAVARSPRSGRVWSVLARPDEMVSKGQVVSRLLDCNEALVTAIVSESVFSRLAIGAPAKFKVTGGRRLLPAKIINLIGQPAATEDLAVELPSGGADNYAVTLAVPALVSPRECAVGRRGEVFFGR